MGLFNEKLHREVLRYASVYGSFDSSGIYFETNKERLVRVTTRTVYLSGYVLTEGKHMSVTKEMLIDLRDTVSKLGEVSEVEFTEDMEEKYRSIAGLVEVSQTSEHAFTDYIHIERTITSLGCVTYMPLEGILSIVKSDNNFLIFDRIYLSERTKFKGCADSIITGTVTEKYSTKYSLGCRRMLDKVQRSRLCLVAISDSNGSTDGSLSMYVQGDKLVIYPNCMWIGGKTIHSRHLSEIEYDQLQKSSITAKSVTRWGEYSKIPKEKSALSDVNRLFTSMRGFASGVRKFKHDGFDFFYYAYVGDGRTAYYFPEFDEGCIVHGAHSAVWFIDNSGQRSVRVNNSHMSLSNLCIEAVHLGKVFTDMCHKSPKSSVEDYCELLGNAVEHVLDTEMCEKLFKSLKDNFT